MDSTFTFSEKSVKELKEKYSVEMKNADDNPIKVCMSLIFEAATQRNPTKRDEISLKLSRFLIKPDGLINLFLALIDFDTSSQRVTTHNQRFMAVANIITCLPKLCIPYPEYCENISRQLRPLLIHPIAQYPTLASLIIKALIESPHAASKLKGSTSGEIRRIVLKPILCSLEEKHDRPNELSISDAIVAIHNLIQNRAPVKLFVGIFLNLLHCLLTLKNTSSHLKVYLRHTLIGILSGLKPGPACCLLEQTLLETSNKCNKYSAIARDDEITIVISEQTDFSEDDLDELVIDLVEGADHDLLTLEFFFHFQARMWSSSDRGSSRRCAALIEPLLTRTMQDTSDLKQDLFTSMATNAERSLELITRALSNYLDFLKNNQTSTIASSSLVSCVKILEVLCSTGQIDEVGIFKSKTVPVVRAIRSSLSGDENKETDQLVQCLEAFLRKFSGRDPTTTSNEKDTAIQREHDSIMKDLNDELVPVRVHALVRLKQLILANDKITIERIPHLYSIVECSLADQESYVFLASVNLLAEMALRRTDEILPKLVDLHSKEGLGTQQRINVGEVLARLTRRLNETTPYYAMQIMNALLAGVDDGDELIRMSSLTNIGLVASNLGQSLSKYILDILVCVDRVLSADTVPVKCAAIDLLRTTLMSLNRMNVEGVQRELKSIYQMLKKLRFTTLDEKLCLQITLALDEIDRLAKEMILATSDGRQAADPLVKNIRVLSLLD